MISTACAVRSPKPGPAMQDVLKMMSSPPEAFTSLGPEKGFRDQVGHWTFFCYEFCYATQTDQLFMSQIEALKTREGARRLSDAIRKVNPQLGTALIDERDKASRPYCVGQRHTIKSSRTFPLGK